LRRSFLARIGLAFVSGILAAGALTAPASAADDAVITGALTDPAGKPVNEAMVFIENVAGGGTQLAFTDQSGTYSSDVAPGTYRVSFQWHYLRQYAYQKVSADDAATFTVGAGETVRVDDRLLPTGTVRGHLTHRDGTPLAFAGVSLHRDGPEAPTGSTDQDGFYSLGGILPGEYQVSFEWQGTTQYMPGSVDRAGAATFTVVAGQTTTMDDSVLPPASLRGRLVDSDGRPLESFTVNAISGGLETYSDVTDQNGEWSMTDVPAASYRVSFHNPQRTRVQWAYGKPDEQTATRIRAGGGQTATVDDTWLPDTTLVVKAADASSGAPVDRLCVRQSPDQRPVCNGADGTVVLANLPAGPITFDVETPAGSLYHWKRGVSATVAANQTTTVTVPLALGGNVAITATDQVTGQSVPDACFSLRAIGRPESFGVGCTGADGRAAAHQAVVPGTYQVFVQAPGAYGHQWVGASGGTGDQKAAARIVVKRGKTASVPAVRLDRAGTVTGVVTGADGAPLRSVSVSYAALDSRAWGDPERVYTNAAGRYSFGKLGPYAWPLLFVGDGYPQQWSGNVGNRFKAVKIPVTAAGSSTYDMVLKRTSTLHGTLTPAVDRVSLSAYNAITGDFVGTFGHWDSENKATSYEILLAGGQQVQLRWEQYGDVLTTEKWYANASDISTATKIRIPASGVKTLNLTYN
jgi:hypothetical protein